MTVRLPATSIFSCVTTRSFGHNIHGTDMFAVDFIVDENVPLAPLTTLGIGGPARYYMRAGSRDAVSAGVAWAAARGVPLLVLGGGSNVLVADEGFPGLVLRVAVRGVETHFTAGGVEITAGAGVNWNALVSRAVARGWAGLECLSGIPGLVGATPIQNVGAYGQEVRETIVDVEALDLTTGETVTLTNDACDFGYRVSRFKLADRGRFIIMAVRFRLTPGGTPVVRNIELERILNERALTHPTIADMRDLVLEIRQRKSMLLDALDPNARSAGSFFTNPVLPAYTFLVLEERIRRACGPSAVIPRFPAANGQVKIPAAWLIEHAGFGKGHIYGNVGISEKHTLALINRGAASARELVGLAREIRERVYERFGILLVPEPAFVGISLEV